MTPERAEQQIVHLVHMLDAYRGLDVDVLERLGIDPKNREGAVAAVEQAIQELKKVTGPRHIVGAAHFNRR